MAQYTAYANYVIYFRDEAEYNFAIAVAGGVNYLHCPKTAADQFGLTYPPGTGGPLDPVKGMYTVSLYSIDDTGTQVNHPAPSGVFLKGNVDFVIVPGQGGNPATFPTGPDMKLVWSGCIVRAGGDAGANPDVPTRAPIPQRRFIMGFEGPTNAESNSGSPTNRRSRDSSRTVEGIGWGLRNDTNTSVNHQINDYGATNPTKSWERFYFQVRVAGAINLDIWRTVSSPSPNQSAQLVLNTDGSFTVNNISTTGVVTALGTSAPIIVTNTWYKVDCIIEYNPLGVGGNGRIRVFINGSPLFDFTVAQGSGGIGSNGSTHVSTILGTQTVTANAWEIDFDDWINADIPNIGGVETLNSLDWLAGTHIQKVWNTGFTLGTWTGQGQSTNQVHAAANATAGSRLTNSNANAILEALTDANDNQDNTVGLKLGVASALVAPYTFLASGTVTGNVGYRIAGAAAVFFAISPAESSTPQFRSGMYRPQYASVLPPTIVPFSVDYQKANSGVVATVQALQGIVEYVGTWGAEDDPTMQVINANQFIHNAPYGNQPWAFVGPVPDGPVMAIGGTYTGNGTQQDINLGLPAHFLWIRALSGGSGPVNIFSSSIGGHVGNQNATIPEDVVRLWVDSTGQPKFTVVGTGVNINANGVTFQYIAFCDPAMRFNICGAYMHVPAVTSFANPIIDGNFIPIAEFFQPENLAASATIGLSYKGPGHSGTTGNLTSGTALANMASFAQGVLTSGADCHIAQLQGTYSLWRSAGDNCSNIMVQIVSYTGNGAGGTRNIALTPASSRFPLFAMVIPHNAVGFFRDPSHAANSCSNINTLANSATAIQGGGVDFITVGTTLNANGVVYDVFVIPGDSAGWNNGTFFSPNCLPNGNQWPAPDFHPSGDINLLTEGGLIIGGVNALTLLKDVSGIYTLVSGKTNDTVYDRQPGQTTKDVAIPNPFAEGGYIGG